MVASVALSPSLPGIAHRLHREWPFDIVHLHFPDPLGPLTASLLPAGMARVAVRLLPQYEADDGPLTAAQLRQIKKRAPQGKKRSVRSSLFEVGSA